MSLLLCHGEPGHRDRRPHAGTAQAGQGIFQNAGGRTEPIGPKGYWTKPALFLQVFLMFKRHGEITTYYQRFLPIFQCQNVFTDRTISQMITKLA